MADQTPRSTLAEVASLLKRIYGESASNIESVLRGSAAAIPGTVGDIESIFRDDKNRRFATTEEVLRDYMPRRLTAPTAEASGFQSVGTYLPLPIPSGTGARVVDLGRTGLRAAIPTAAEGAVRLAEKYGVAPTMYVVKPGKSNLIGTPEQRALEQGYIDYLHGTQRLDRLLEGKTLNPKRATSGPMPFGTTGRELASNYAMSKPDTSRAAEDFGDLKNYFQVSKKDIGIGGKSLIPAEDAWHYLSPEKKMEILDKARRIGYENPEEAVGKFVLHETSKGAPFSEQHWDFTLKREAGGNPLKALRKTYAESGMLDPYEPSELSDIYRLAGFDVPITQTNAPWTEAKGVFLGKARITNPLYTNDVDNLKENVIPYLKEQFKNDRTKKKKYGADDWDKNVRFTPKEWVEQLEKDVNAGENSYVWTSIPDKITNTLKDGFGYNGIIDVSGKSGTGTQHPVVIPFDPGQIRSRFAAFDPEKIGKPDLLAGVAPLSLIPLTENGVKEDTKKSHGGLVYMAKGGDPAKEQTRNDSSMPNIVATPVKSPTLLAIANALRSADKFARAPFGYTNPPIEILSDILSVPSLYRTLENVAYGSPLTRGTGQARVMTPDTVGAVEALANLSPAGPAVIRTGKVLGKAVAPTAARQAVQLAEKYGVSPTMNVIKPKGGDWLYGSIDETVDPLKRNFSPTLAELEKGWAEMGIADSPGAIAIRSQRAPEEAINNWLDKKLASYLRNEMGTPEDPVRLALEAFPARKAEMLAAKQAQIDKAVADMEKAREARGFTPEMMTRSQARIRQLEAEKALIQERQGLHVDPENLTFGHRTTHPSGRQKEILGVTPASRSWENAADYSIYPETAERFLNRIGGPSGLLPQNKFVENLAPEKDIYAMSPGHPSDLGFDHLVDEMRNALDPASALPPHLKLDAKKLDKMTLPQIIDRVDEINAWRAVQKAEANAAIAANKATVLHKEYATIPGTDLPNEEGLRWVELKMPEGVDEKDLADALKYEGDMLQHCVGGYCPDVVEGRSRIFSLRDNKFRPRATIEVKPEGLDFNKWLGEQSPEFKAEIFARRAADKNYNIFETPEYLSARELVPSRIHQIKGHRNRAPEEQYLPFVQDFVRSQKWSDIGDIQNTGMRAARDVFNETELSELRELGHEPGHILSGSEIQQLHNLIVPEGKRLIYDAKGNIVGTEPGFAEGGSVKKDAEMNMEDLLNKYDEDVALADISSGSDPLYYEERAVLPNVTIVEAPPLSDANEAARQWLESKMSDEEEGEEPIIDLGSLHAIKLASDPLMTPTPENQGFVPDPKMMKNQYYKAAIKMANKYGLPPEVFTALIQKESKFNPHAQNKKSGAYGFSQLLEGTAGDLKVNRYDPMQNLEGGAKYLSQLVKKFGSIPLGLAAYNAGMGKVAKAGNTIPKFNETRDYVKTILSDAGMTDELKKFADQLKVIPKKKKATTPAQDAAMKPVLKKSHGGLAEVEDAAYAIPDEAAISKFDPDDLDKRVLAIKSLLREGNMSSADEPAYTPEELNFLEEKRRFNLNKLANKFNLNGVDSSMVGLSGNLDLGDLGALEAAIERGKSMRGEIEVPYGSKRLSYRNSLGDLMLRANLIKPDDTSGVYIGSLSGSMPIGKGYGFASLGATKTPVAIDPNTLVVGYGRPVGAGEFNINALLNKYDKKPMVNVNYAIPFAKGGSVKAYDEESVNALVKQIHEAANV